MIDLVEEWFFNMDARLFFKTLVLIPILIWATMGHIEYHFPNRFTTPIYKITKYLTYFVLLIDIYIFFTHENIIQ